jgi:hypothetical protein
MGGNGHDPYHDLHALCKKSLVSRGPRLVVCFEAGSRGIAQLATCLSGPIPTEPRE